MRVCHFVRKKAQLQSSFIKNQIIYHESYKPYIVYIFSQNANNDSGSVRISEHTKFLELEETENIFEKMNYKFFKRISFCQALNIQKFVEENKIDVLHFHYGSDSGLYLPFLKKTRIPSLASFYGYDCFSFPRRFFGYGKYYLQNRVFDYIDIVLAMSPEMERDLLALGCPQNKIIVHYHGVPSKEFVDLKVEYKLKTSITLFMLSYLDPVKGHLFLFKALLLLKQKGFRNIRLRIAGNGNYRDVLERFLEDNDLQDQVIFIGSLKYCSTEYKAEFGNADIFVHPSVTTKDDKEGIPGALVEAMFAGLPIISTNHGGIPYIIKNRETGLLVNEWDTNALAFAIEKLSHDIELRKSLGSAARKYALRHLDLLDKERELEEIYDSLVNN